MIKPRSLSPTWNASTLCSIVVDRGGNYVEVSEAFCKLLGYPREKMMGMKYADLTAPGSADAATVKLLFERCGYMHGLWLLLTREGTRVLVRYESWGRPDSLIQTDLEVIGAGY